MQRQCCVQKGLHQGLVALEEQGRITLAAQFTDKGGAGLLVETDPLNHPAILAANAGHKCALKYPVSLNDPSESVSQSARGWLKAD